MDWEGRITGLERWRRLVARKLNDTLERLGRAETDIQQRSGGGLGGGGGSEPAYWTVGDGLGNAATGTWPTLTPYTFTADVYKFVGTTQTLVASGVTVNWPYKDPMDTTAGKLMPLKPNDDGTSYDAIEESCMVVT